MWGFVRGLCGGGASPHMATPTAQETLDALKSARLDIITGKTARVSVGGVTREFLSLEQLEKAIATVSEEVAAENATYAGSRAQIEFS